MNSSFHENIIHEVNQSSCSNSTFKNLLLIHTYLLLIRELLYSENELFNGEIQKVFQ